MSCLSGFRSQKCDTTSSSGTRNIAKKGFDAIHQQSPQVPTPMASISDLLFVAFRGKLNISSSILLCHICPPMRSELLLLPKVFSPSRHGTGVVFELLLRGELQRAQLSKNAMLAVSLKPLSCASAPFRDIA